MKVRGQLWFDPCKPPAGAARSAYTYRGPMGHYVTRTIQELEQQPVQGGFNYRGRVQLARQWVLVQAYEKQSGPGRLAPHQQVPPIYWTWFWIMQPGDRQAYLAWDDRPDRASWTPVVAD